jgi:hypothetical protein
MKQTFEITESVQRKAQDVIEDTNIIEIWSSIGATINLVGSLIENGVRDIDSFWQWHKKNPSEGIITWIP